MTIALINDVNVYPLINLTNIKKAMRQFIRGLTASIKKTIET